MLPIPTPSATAPSGAADIWFIALDSDLSDMTRPMYWFSTIVWRSDADVIRLAVKNVPLRHQATAATGIDRVSPNTTSVRANAAPAQTMILPW